MDWSVLLGEDAAVIPPGRALLLVFLMTGVRCSSDSIRNISVVVGVAKTSGVAVVEADAE